jgi:hypothetical protein
MLSTAMASTAGSWGYTRKITVKETVILVGQADYDSDTEPLKIRGAGTGRENVWRMLKVARGAGARIKTLAITGAEGPELNIPAADCPFLGRAQVSPCTLLGTSGQPPWPGDGRRPPRRWNPGIRRVRRASSALAMP